MTTQPIDSITFPFKFSDFTDQGLDNLIRAFRAEKLRRARVAGLLAEPANDPDDAVLETLTGEQLAAIACRFDSEVCIAGADGGHGGGLVN